MYKRNSTANTLILQNLGGTPDNSYNMHYIIGLHTVQIVASVKICTFLSNKLYQKD